MNADITSTRLTLRRIDPTKDSFAEYLGWLRDTDNNQYIKSANKDFKLSDLTGFVNKMNESQTALLLGIFLSSEPKLIGTVKLEPINYPQRTAWLGMLIGDVASRGMGYGFEALGAVLEYAASDLKLQRIFLGVDKLNNPAIRLYSKIGFRVKEENESSLIMSFDLEDFNLH